MQVVQEKDIDRRIMFYWGKTYTGEIKEGDRYSSLQKTIVILIANLKLYNLTEIPKFHTKWQIREEKRDKVALWSMFILNPGNVGDEYMSEKELKIPIQQIVQLT